MASRNLIPILYLLACLSYDPETGVLRWRERPRSHFPDDRTQHTWNTKWAGREAGQIDRNGYRLLVISINGKQHRILAHRAAWALQTGKYPPFEINHDDTDHSNNRFANLRPATHGETAQTRRGVRGTWFNRLNGNFRACIQVDYRRIYLGSYNTEAEARQAYLDAKKKHHPFKPTPPETAA